MTPPARSSWAQWETIQRDTGQYRCMFCDTPLPVYDSRVDCAEHVTV